MIRCVLLCEFDARELKILTQQQRKDSVESRSPWVGKTDPSYPPITAGARPLTMRTTFIMNIHPTIPSDMVYDSLVLYSPRHIEFLPPCL